MANSSSLTTYAGVVGRGLLAGALATVPMSGLMAAGKLLGLLGTPPPKQITANAAGATVARTLDVLDVSKLAAVPRGDPSGAFRALWMGGHIGYGAACGGVFAALQRLLPQAPDWLLGLGFGLLVWGTSYLGWVPALRLYPRPERDSPGRMATMIAAHIVFGLTLAEINRRLNERERHVTDG
jgi:hypothetical protein